MARFHVPQVARLAMAETYTGSFVGWMDVPIVSETATGILTVTDPTDPDVEWGYLREELEANGRAKAVNGPGPDAFAPGQWEVELGRNDVIVAYIPKPKGEPAAVPVTA